MDKGEGRIPSIFSKPLTVSVNNNQATFTLEKAHDCNVGDKVEIITNDQSQAYTITAIQDAKCFTIDNWTASDQASDIFVYGKKINDFHTVNYDRVFTLAVSALQELNRKVETLEKTLSSTQKENQQLKTALNQKDIKQTNLKADVELLNDRMRKLESLFEATGKK